MDAAGINKTGETGGIEENKDLIAEDIQKEKEAKSKGEDEVTLSISEISEMEGSDNNGGLGDTEAKLNSKEEAELLELMKEKQEMAKEESTLLEQVKQDSQKVTDRAPVDVPELPKEIETMLRPETTSEVDVDSITADMSIENRKVGDAIDIQNIERTNDYIDHIEDSVGKTRDEIEMIGKRTESEKTEHFASIDHITTDQNEDTREIEDAIKNTRKEHKDIDAKRAKGISDEGQMLRDRQKRQETTVVGTQIETETRLNDTKDHLDEIRDQLGSIEDKIRGVKNANPEAAKKVAE